MSFEKLESGNMRGAEGKECILIYQFHGKELETIQRMLKLVGMHKQIIVESTMVENTVEDIVNEKITISEKNDKVNHAKALVFHGTASKKLNMVLDTLKKTGLKRPLVAVVTDTSKAWTFSHLLVELSKEKEALSKNKPIQHEESI
ncbi:MAG: DUF3783 domain-containing protein [Cellulosilyticaceae bacterium]